MLLDIFHCVPSLFQIIQGIQESNIELSGYKNYEHIIIIVINNASTIIPYFQHTMKYLRNPNSTKNRLQRG